MAFFRPPSLAWYLFCITGLTPYQADLPQLNARHPLKVRDDVSIACSVQSSDTRSTYALHTSHWPCIEDSRLELLRWLGRILQSQSLTRFRFLHGSELKSQSASIYITAPQCTWLSALIRWQFEKLFIFCFNKIHEIFKLSIPPTKVLFSCIMQVGIKLLWIFNESHDNNI